MKLVNPLQGNDYFRTASNKSTAKHLTQVHRMERSGPLVWISASLAGRPGPVWSAMAKDTKLDALGKPGVDAADRRRMACLKRRQPSTNR